jgi:HAD superfamily hydrolase (TIGR01484 family)
MAVTPLSQAGPVAQRSVDQIRRSLYVCDLDGTLLRSDATLSEYSRRTLNRLLDDGVLITVASARSAVAIRSLMRGVSLRLPVIELDGVFVTDLVTGAHLNQQLLGAVAAHVAVSTLAEIGHDGVLTTFDGMADHVYFSPKLNIGTGWYIEEKRRYTDPRLRRTDDLFAVVAAEATAMVTGFVPIAEADAALRRLAVALGDTAAVSGAPHAYIAGWTEIRVAGTGAHKGAAIRSLLTVGGIEGVEVVACGDHMNDLPMFSAADRAVAPANALAEVRARADILVAGNDVDGVVRFLEAGCGPRTS